MASDIILVLRAEHRELLNLAEQCGRSSRGFQHPEEELRRRLGAHVAAAGEAVYPAGVIGTAPDAALQQVLAAVAAQVEHPRRDAVAQQAAALVEIERAQVLPALESLLIGDRRRSGKLFRILRERHMRHYASTVRRQRSQSELYEVARRAGLEHRSRMTLAQLEAAVSEWERSRRVQGGGPMHGGLQHPDPSPAGY